MKAMILAAGIGSRLKPLTDNQPKALIKIDEVTLLEHTINYLKYHGINEIIVNVYHFASEVIHYLKEKNNFGIRIEVSDETGKLLNTGGGLKKAEWFFNNNSPFILTAVDVFTDLNLNDLLEYHKEQKALVTLAVKNRPSTRELLFSAQMLLCGWKSNITSEIKYVSDITHYRYAIAFSGIHVIQPEIFKLVTEEGPFPIIDLYLRLANRHKIVGFVNNNSKWYELGRYENFSRMERELGFKEVINKYNKK
ncbi:MAG: NTP transferase domain-containing protein [Bacteroidales bacterium]|nr:NTP transferase domain-containing protein [Bacteroidales bacterium]